MRMKKNSDAVKLATSAMGNAHHTIFTSPLRLKRYAAGSSATIWRQREVMVEYMPLPSAWKEALKTMQMAATGKWMLMIRKAVLPSSTKVGESSKILNSTPGIKVKARNPNTMKHTAVPQEIFRVLVIRLGLRAP